jgi:hypothetical protein
MLAEKAVQLDLPPPVADNTFDDGVATAPTEQPPLKVPLVEWEPLMPPALNEALHILAFATFGVSILLGIKSIAATETSALIVIYDLFNYSHALI